MTASAASQRVLIWTTLILLVIYSVGYCMLGFARPPAPTLEAAQVVALYTAHHLQFQVGVVLCLASGAFLLPWSVAVAVQMARLEKGVPIWAIMQALAGALGTILLWGPPLLWGAAGFSAGEVDPGLTLILHQLGWLMFITPLCLFPMQLFPIGFISLTKTEPDRISAFPRWIGYLTIWQAVQSFGGEAAMLFKVGPFAWNGAFPFYIPLTLYGVWTIAMAVTLLRAIRHQEGAARGAVPYGAQAAE